MMSSPDADERSTSSSPDPEPPFRAFLEERLKTIAREEQSRRRNYENHGTKHDILFSRAISNILSTELALQTYAEIIDGLPVRDSVMDGRNLFIPREHPVREHLQICPAAMDKARAFREEFAIESLSFSSKLLHAYRQSQLGSQSFHVRLIELVSVSIHQIGVYLSKLDLCLHEGGYDLVSRVRQWTHDPLPPELRDKWWQPSKPEPTLFYHPHYKSLEIYAEEVHDMVGYWAENRILGGVTAFDRRAERSKPNSPPNIIMDSSHSHRTDRLFQLHDDQQKKLIDFLLVVNTSNDTRTTENIRPTEESGNERESAHPNSQKRKRNEIDVACPLPILPEDSNRTRWQYWQAITEYEIYRDIWERMPPTIESRRILGRRPVAAIDAPEMRDIMLFVNKSGGITPPWKKQRTANDSEQQEHPSTEDKTSQNGTDRRSADPNRFDWKAAWDEIDVGNIINGESEENGTGDREGDKDHDGTDGNNNGQENASKIQNMRHILDWNCVTLNRLLESFAQSAEEEDPDISS